MTSRTFQGLLSMVAASLFVSSAAMAQSKGRLPQLAGKECIRDVCLGDELGKFAPGSSVNKLQTQSNVWGRKAADVLRDMKPLYAQASDQTLALIAQEQLRSGSPVLRIPLTPAIHEALVADKVQVCGFATVRAQVENRHPEKWSLVFSALPHRFVDGRQAWVLTDIEVQIQGTFDREDLKKLSTDLANRAPSPDFFTQVVPAQGGQTVTMRWDPVAAYTGGDISYGALTEKTRQMFGCRSTDAVPSL